MLFGQPQRSFYASELIRDAGTGSGAAQRELARLEGRGLVVARRIGNQKHYQANAASPLFAELRSMVLKTVGLAELLRDALKPMTRDIRAAFVYGSVAKASDQAASDIDLMVVSDNLSYGDVFGALDKVSRTLGRDVNSKVYSAAEFSKRAKSENVFRRASARRTQGVGDRIGGRPTPSPVEGPRPQPPEKNGRSRHPTRPQTESRQNGGTSSPRNCYHPW